ncbi:MAG: tetratricopeptide repeat protein [Candidatus Competibacter sp.]
MWRWRSTASSAIIQQGEAAAYHQLGRIAEERRDFAAAERWYQQSLAIKEKQGNEHGAAITYHQLGRIAEERRDFAAAERWYQQSLAIKEKQGDEHGAASTYHQLGRIAEERRDFAAAERWYQTVAGDLGKAGQRARRGDHLSPVGDDRRGAARLRGGGAVVSDSRWRLRKSRATSTARRAPITSWG